MVYCGGVTGAKTNPLVAKINLHLKWKENGFIN